MGILRPLPRAEGRGGAVQPRPGQRVRVQFARGHCRRASSASTSFSNTGLAASTTYYYVVKYLYYQYGDAVLSPISNAVVVSIDATPPGSVDPVAIESATDRSFAGVPPLSRRPFDGV